MWSWIHPFDDNARGFAVEITIEMHLVRELLNRSGIVRIDAPVKHMPRDRAIQRARVHVDESNPLRELTRDAAFPGRGRTIDRDDAMIARLIRHRPGKA